MKTVNGKQIQANGNMSLGEHLEDLRHRLIYSLLGIMCGVIVCLFFGARIVSYIREPYTVVMTSQGQEPLLQTLAPADGFVSYVKVAILIGVILSSPWIFYHFWQFIASGLYPKEKKYIHLVVPISTMLFVSGALFFIKIVSPLSLRFFIVFNKEMLGIDSAFTFQNYLSFITNLTLVFGFAFQTPTAIFFLNKAQLVSLSSLRKARKYVLFVVFIVAALATPPDIVSQITLAIPLYLLFELGIILSRFIA